MSRLSLARRFIPLLAIFLLIFAGCSTVEFGALNPKGPVGEDQLWLIMLSTIIMVTVLIVVFALFFYVIIRYRKRRGQTGIPKQVEGNNKLELIWTIIPLFLIFILAVPTVAKTFELAEEFRDPGDALQVKVIAHQFWWEFEYEDYNIITAQELLIPINKRVQYELVSTDVNHSFWIPELGGKMDNTAGQANTFYLQADEAGTYRGRCAELCGAGHALMYFSVKAVSQEEFDLWVQQMQAPFADVPQGLEKGYKVFSSKCISCHAISTDVALLGPNLKGFANREFLAGFFPNENDNIRAWLDNPSKVKQGTQMPEVPLTDQEIDELVKYLNNLK